MKKSLALGVIAIIAGVLLAACGGNGGILSTRGCELTQALQGRWEGEAGWAGKAPVVVFDGDSVVEYGYAVFQLGRALTQEDLDNNTPIYDPWEGEVYGWDNSGAVHRELISIEEDEGYWVHVRERREGTFAVGDADVLGNYRIEILWGCGRGHEVSTVAVNINQLGADTLSGRWGHLARVEG